MAGISQQRPGKNLWDPVVEEKEIRVEEGKLTSSVVVYLEERIEPTLGRDHLFSHSRTLWDVSEILDTITVDITRKHNSIRTEDSGALNIEVEDFVDPAEEVTADTEVTLDHLIDTYRPELAESEDADAIDQDQLEEDEFEEPEPVSLSEASNALTTIKCFVQQNPATGTTAQEDEQAALALQRLEKYKMLLSLKRPLKQTSITSYFTPVVQGPGTATTTPPTTTTKATADLEHQPHRLPRYATFATAPTSATTATTGYETKDKKREEDKLPEEDKTSWALSTRGPGTSPGRPTPHTHTDTTTPDPDTQTSFAPRPRTQTGTPRNPQPKHGIVIHGVALSKDLGKVRRWLETDNQNLGKTTGIRWLRRETLLREEGKKTSSVVVYTQTMKEAGKVRLGGKWLRMEVYEPSRGRR
ncbi:hypothetical protein BDZ91DRAFT_799374 [Kalaharituber pfeilii]|nr:hypothetical protein BDZ91DRAFT_799374 [Kalaharituber pfeilii]